MSTTTAAATATTGLIPQDFGVDPELKPLPVWFFGFEGILSGAYDLCKANPHLLPFVIGAGAINALVSFTVLRKRLKLVKSLLKNSRTRFIAIGLLALRFGVHLILGLLGSAVAGATGHIVLAAVMAVCTVTLLWFDQRVSFRALGLSTKR